MRENCKEHEEVLSICHEEVSIVKKTIDTNSINSTKSGYTRKNSYRRSSGKKTFAGFVKYLLQITVKPFHDQEPTLWISRGCLYRREPYQKLPASSVIQRWRTDKQNNRGLCLSAQCLRLSECFFHCYRPDAAKQQTAGIKFTHRPKIRFLAPSTKLYKAHKDSVWRKHRTSTSVCDDRSSFSMWHCQNSQWRNRTQFMSTVY